MSTVEQKIRQAVADPGATVGDRRPGEDLPGWQTRAVVEVLTTGRWIPETQPATRGPIFTTFVVLLILAVGCSIGVIL